MRRRRRQLQVTLPICGAVSASISSRSLSSCFFSILFCVYFPPFFSLCLFLFWRSNCREEGIGAFSSSLFAPFCDGVFLCSRFIFALWFVSCCVLSPFASVFNLRFFLYASVERRRRVFQRFPTFSFCLFCCLAVILPVVSQSIFRAW